MAHLGHIRVKHAVDRAALAIELLRKASKIINENATQTVENGAAQPNRNS